MLSKTTQACFNPLYLGDDPWKFQDQPCDCRPAPGGIEFPISPSRAFGPPGYDENTGTCGERRRLSKRLFSKQFFEAAITRYGGGR